MIDSKSIRKQAGATVTLKQFKQCAGFDCKFFFSDGTVLFARPFMKRKKYYLSVEFSCILLGSDNTNIEIEIFSITEFLNRLKKISIPVLV
jgi:hypothetical protein